MAREIVVLCDPCLAEDVRTAAVESTVAVEIGAVKPNAKLKALALCERHQTELLKPLADVLNEFGVAVDGSPKAPAPLDGERRSGRGGRVTAEELAANAAATGKRKGRQPTGERLAQCLWCELAYTAKSGSGFMRHLRVNHGFHGFVEAFGGLCPLCGEGPYDLMLAHVQKTHPEFGFIVVSQPFLWARDNGDPYGQYAERVERKGSLDPEKAWQDLRAKESAIPSSQPDATAKSRARASKKATKKAAS